MNKNKIKQLNCEHEQVCLSHLASMTANNLTCATVSTTILIFNINIGIMLLNIYNKCQWSWHFNQLMISICEVSESKTSLAIAANAKINVDTNFWIKISSLSATLPSLIGDMMMGSWSDIFGKKRMAIMWCFFKIYICFL